MKLFLSPFHCIKFGHISTFRSIVESRTKPFCTSPRTGYAKSFTLFTWHAGSCRSRPTVFGREKRSLNRSFRRAASQWSFSLERFSGSSHNGSLCFKSRTATKIFEKSGLMDSYRIAYYLHRLTFGVWFLKVGYTTLDAVC